MENFNFKVGDKIQYNQSGEVEILLLFGENKRNDLFTGINQQGEIKSNYSKQVKWKLYRDTKQKQKLQKFYCTDSNIRFDIQYAINKEKIEEIWVNIYTEEEFLEKFDVEL